MGIRCIGKPVLSTSEIKNEQRKQKPNRQKKTKEKENKKKSQIFEFLKVLGNIF